MEEKQSWDRNGREAIVGWKWKRSEHGIHIEWKRTWDTNGREVEKEKNGSP
jgi:hypothetical protein